MSSVPSIKLKDGNSIPVLGLGTYLTGGQSVSWALGKGYRLIDTATLYENEEEIGQSIKESGVPREELYIVTKVWDTDHGYQETKDAFHLSLKKLGLEYVDLYLVHSSVGGKTLETWTAILELKKQGLIRSVGVSNFNKHHLVALQEVEPEEMPVVNQIEVHPFLAWEDCVSYCKDHDIVVMAYSPLAKAEKLKDKTLCRIADKYGKTAAQVMIKWSVQQGYVCVPKTSKKERMEENISIFDFEMTPAEMQELTDLAEGYISDLPCTMNDPWLP